MISARRILLFDVKAKSDERLNFGSLAQLAEQVPLKDKVRGSIPRRPITITEIYAPVAQLEERLASNQQVAGSSPAGRVRLRQNTASV